MAHPPGTCDSVLTAAHAMILHSRLLGLVYSYYDAVLSLACPLILYSVKLLRPATYCVPSISVYASRKCAPHSVHASCLHLSVHLPRVRFNANFCFMRHACSRLPSPVHISGLRLPSLTMLCSTPCANTAIVFCMLLRPTRRWCAPCLRASLSVHQPRVCATHLEHKCSKLQGDSHLTHMCQASPQLTHKLDASECSTPHTTNLLQG